MKDSKIKKKNPNYVSENRYWVSVKRHVPVIGNAIGIGIICALIQYLISSCNFTYNKEAENVILFLPMAFAFFVYVIFAGYAINRVLDESKIVSRAIVIKDLDTFLSYRDEQLPILFHLPLVAVSLIIVFFAIFFPYPDVIIGMSSVFSLVFIMALLFLITEELDNYENSIWFREKTPKEWWDIEVEEYFKIKNEIRLV